MSVWIGCCRVTNIIIVSHKINTFHPRIWLIKWRNCYKIDKKITYVSIKIYISRIFFPKTFDRRAECFATPLRPQKTIQKLNISIIARTHPTMCTLERNKYYMYYVLCICYAHTQYCVVPIQTSIEANVNLGMKLYYNDRIVRVCACVRLCVLLLLCVCAWDCA